MMSLTALNFVQIGVPEVPLQVETIKLVDLTGQLPMNINNTC